MPLIFQDHITRADLRTNPDHRFLFGDNEERRGHAGQAAACRGKPNAIGVATKRSPNQSPGAYWSDADHDRAITLIDTDLAPAFDHIRAGGTVVCPAAGLGTGLSQLPTRAPRIFAHLRHRVIELKRLDKAATDEPRAPRVLNTKTDRIPPDAIYCGRPSPFGNPFTIGRDGTRDDVCDKYALWLPTQPSLVALLPRLRGHDLACWCAPARCHCETLIRLANPDLVQP